MPLALASHVDAGSPRFVTPAPGLGPAQASARRAGLLAFACLACLAFCSVTVSAGAGAATTAGDAAGAPSSAAATDRATAPPPASAFGRLPALSTVALSPDGQRVAWIAHEGTRASIVVLDVATGAALRQIPVDAKLRDLGWADDDTVLFEVSVTSKRDSVTRQRHEYFRMMAVDATGNGRARMLLMDDGSRSWVTDAALLAWRTPTPGRVVMSSLDWLPTAQREEIGSRIRNRRKDSGWVHTLFDVDTRTGVGTPREYGTPLTRQWIVDANGNALARTEWEADRGNFRLLARRGAGWAVAYEGREIVDRPWIAGAAPDGSGVLAIAVLDADPRTKLWHLPFDGSPPRLLVDDPEFGVEAVEFDPYTRAPVGIWIGGLQPRIRWIDPAAETAFARIQRSFPGKTVRITGRSADGQRVLAAVSTPSEPAVHYLVDFAARRADTVGEAYPELVGATLGTLTTRQYRARDGATIPAYLTLPPGREAKALPLVVLPHGGPEARDHYAFDWFAQFLATRGYAVLQPQFRGSTGFGEAHRLAGYGEWGGRMQDDVTDGVRALVEQGIADPARVCIVGASYGGYAALAGATLTPELYACAVSINGVTDLPAMLGNERVRGGDESAAVAYWNRHIGSVHDPKVAERSPARRAADVRAPVLLMHGVDDTVVPIAQSRAMARALKREGKAHTFLELPGEDHWLSAAATRTRVLEETERFLAAHLSPAPAP